MSTTIFREKLAEICSLISLKVLADWVNQSWQEEETKYGFYIISLNSIKTGYLYESYLSFSVLKFLGMKSLSIFWNITTTLSNFIWFILVCVMFKKSRNVCLNLLPRDIFWQFTIDTNITFNFYFIREKWVLRLLSQRNNPIYKTSSCSKTNRTSCTLKLVSGSENMVLSRIQRMFCYIFLR